MTTGTTNEKPAKQEKPQTLGASDLAKQLNLEPRVARQELRKLAKKDDDARLRVNAEGHYSWTRAELNAVAKKVQKAIDANKDKSDGE